MKLFAALITGALLLQACAPKILFNHDLRQNLQTRAVMPEQLQFYIDRDVELRREINTDNTRLNAGTVQLVKGKKTELISIPKFTPGVCLKQTDGSLQVAFEGNNERYLTFMETADNNGVLVYRLVSKRNSNQEYEVKYGNETYYLNETDAGAAILIKRKLNSREKTKTHVVKGRKLR